MARWRLPGLALIIGLAVCPSAGRAATAYGTLITNVATITMTSGSPDFVRFEMSFNMTCSVLIVSPASVRVGKDVSPTIELSGGTLTYTIWFVNNSAMASSFNIVATDPLPANVSYDAARGSWDGNSGGAWSSKYSSDNILYFAGQPATGQSAPCYLRFTLSQLGPARSAFMSYSVTIQ